MEKKNNLSIPTAIIAAGIIIAFGIYLSKSSTPSTQTETNQTSAIQINPISATDHILGNPNAPIVIVEFVDLECPFCKAFEGTMNSLMSTYGKDGKLAWVYRHFPLNIHPKYSEKESEASECANELGGQSAFWKYTES